MDLSYLWEVISEFELEDGTKLGSHFKSGNDKINFCQLVRQAVESQSESYERFTNHFAKSLQEFGRIGHHRDGSEFPLPQNAITLWRHMVDGFNRVADRLTAPPEK
jgi:hypothetical protein